MALTKTLYTRCSYLPTLLQQTLRQSALTCSNRHFKHRSHQETFKFVDLQELFTKKPKTIPPNDSLKFGHMMTDHMFEVQWSNDRGWSKPTIDSYHPLMLDPAAKCLHYALEIFEGTKAYCGNDGKIRLFRPTENFLRMNNSAARLCLPTFDIEEMRLCLHRFVEIEKDWVPQAEGCSLYLRPTMIGTEPSLGVLNSTEAMFYVIASPVGPYFPTGMKPVSLLADPQFVRAWPGGGGDAKLGSNYGPTVLIQKKAIEKGCQQVLWLFGDDHLLTEAGTMNIFVHLKNSDGENELVTPPLSEGVILPGVVRKSILELARSWGDTKISERIIDMNEIITANKEGRLMEMFGSGTACVVCPVERIHYGNNDIAIPTMKTSKPLYQRLYNELNDIYYGRTASSWAEVVCDA